MKEFDVVLLTDSRYVNPKKIDPYIQNVLKSYLIGNGWSRKIKS